MRNNIGVYKSHDLCFRLRLTELVEEEGNVVLLEGLHLHQVVQVVLTQLHHQHNELLEFLQMNSKTHLAR